MLSSKSSLIASISSPLQNHFDADSNATGLQDIAFSAADIEKACADLRGSAAAGPDGVPAIFLKNCRKLLSKRLHCLWRASLDSGSIPDELLLAPYVQCIRGAADLSQKTTGLLLLLHT